jgi:polysaccharide pyruvyl transferase WcaK-like protein
VRKAAKALNSADLIVVRDAASGQVLQKLGVRVTAKVAADMAFLLPQPAVAEDVQSFQVGNMKTVGLAPRKLPGRGDIDVAAVFGELCRMLFRANLMPVLVEMDLQADAALLNEIEKSQGGKMPTIRKAQSPMQLQQRIARMDAMIGMRLHAGILAATCGVPPYMVSYDPKVAAFATGMELPAPPSVSGLTPQRLFEGFMAFYKERERYQAVVARKREEMTTLAKANLDYLAEMLGS